MTIALKNWENFYIIIGAAAGALIGLQFVVLTLIADRPSLRAAEAGAAFATPTIVHFSAALFISALCVVPWQSIIFLAILLGIKGFCGVLYALITIKRMQTQGAYEPEFEDWLFHALLPLVSYVILTASAIAVPTYTREVLFGVGASALLLLFIGIHNSWDAIAYHVFVSRQAVAEQEQRKNSNKT